MDNARRRRESRQIFQRCQANAGRYLSAVSLQCHRHACWQRKQCQVDREGCLSLAALAVRQFHHPSLTVSVKPCTRDLSTLDSPLHRALVARDGRGAVDAVVAGSGLAGIRFTEQVQHAYLSGWDVALLPFARCAATRYISPTKTPEYLAAGRPVVSTAIPDVVRGYGAPGLVRIADAPGDFVAAIAASLAEVRGLKQSMVDLHLRRTSWDATFEHARALLERAAARRRARADEYRGADKQKGAALPGGVSTDAQATV